MRYSAGLYNRQTSTTKVTGKDQENPLKEKCQQRLKNPYKIWDHITCLEMEYNSVIEIISQGVNDLQGNECWFCTKVQRNGIFRIFYN